MNNIKQKVKSLIGMKKYNNMKFKKNVYKHEKAKGNKSAITSILKAKAYDSYSQLFSKLKLKEYKGEKLYYSIDEYKSYLYLDGIVIGNLMIDYSRVLDNDLNAFKASIKEDNKLFKQEKDLIVAIEQLLDREILAIGNEKIVDSLTGIKDRKANGFRDALQRILFFNQILWQTGHYLNGLGRLDMILDKYYYEDIKNKKLTREEAKELLKEFILLLHENYYFKSNSLSGDIGQIIILGGIDNKGNNFKNDLTYMFIELMYELKLPDPKVLLRVNTNTPRDLIELSTKCIQTGIGCPLFANDDVIIPKLVEFGIEKDDAWNYGTSACWEPFITGKSFDQNNIKSINFMKPFNDLTDSDEFKNIDTIETLNKKYKEYLERYIKDFIREINNIKFGTDALLSMLTDNCILIEKDISQGGAKYNNYGFTGVALSNVVNSMIAINKYVFKEHMYTLEEFNTLRKNNFTDNDGLIKTIRNDKEKYGTDNERVIEMTNDIIRFTSKKFEGLKNPLGGKYKFGLSAPSYIDESKNMPASFDGRKNNEPFGVHISSDDSDAYTELVQFAAKLDYGDNRFNGNVVDFFVSPNFINDNFEKFVDFLMLSIKVGFFEMQMNVVSSEVLIEARKNPDKFPNLIVRVWGFSSYFKDLPEDYKDYIIERALKSEGKTA